MNHSNSTPARELAHRASDDFTVSLLCPSDDALTVGVIDSHTGDAPDKHGAIDALHHPFAHALQPDAAPRPVSRALGSVR